MNLINEMSLSFPSKSSNEAFARSAVSAFVIGLDPTVAELSDIKTAVSEAVTNCIVHGYRRESGTVYINGKIYENNKVVIKIRDKGCGIADIEKAMEPLFTTAPEEDRAGLGFAVMQSFCDKVKVKSTVGKGTAVTLEKVISSGRFDWLRSMASRVRTTAWTPSLCSATSSHGSRPWELPSRGLTRTSLTSGEIAAKKMNTQHWPTTSYNHAARRPVPTTLLRRAQ